MNRVYEKPKMAPMQTPDHWQGPKPDLLALLLAPLGLLYGLGGTLSRVFSSPYKAGVPVICIGNLVAGGAGKTPVAIEITRRLKSGGLNPHIISRGYGGSALGPLQVDRGQHTFTEVGDEPLLLAKTAPTWIAKDRKSGIEAAIRAGADVVVLDDGFQNPSIAKDFSLIVIDGGFGFGNGLLIPAGPLRETVPAGLARADAVVVVGSDTHNIEATIHHTRPSLAIIKAHLKPDNADAIKGQRVHAFAGIGRPEKFFNSLRELGCDVLHTDAFPDHHSYGSHEIENIIENASEANAIALTTEKDAARLNAEQLSQISVLNVSTSLSEQGASTLDALLANAVGPRGG